MKAVIIYSGGMDSYTLLNMLMENKDVEELKVLTFYYKQRHHKELDYARRFCEEVKIEFTLMDISNIFQPLTNKSSLINSSKDIPEGHYEDENMKQTFVPNRNMILLSVAAAYAFDNDLDTLAYGAHLGDHQIYPDCRKEFIDAMRVVLSLANYNTIDLHVPFVTLGWDKRDILKNGLAMGLDYSKTWTCYKGASVPCGKCGACVERAEAFEASGIKDPLL